MKGVSLVVRERVLLAHRASVGTGEVLLAAGDRSHVRHDVSTGVDETVKEFEAVIVPAFLRRRDAPIQPADSLGRIDDVAREDVARVSDEAGRLVAFVRVASHRQPIDSLGVSRNHRVAHRVAVVEVGAPGIPDALFQPLRTHPPQEFREVRGAAEGQRVIPRLHPVFEVVPRHPRPDRVRKARRHRESSVGVESRGREQHALEKSMLGRLVIDVGDEGDEDVHGPCSCRHDGNPLRRKRGLDLVAQVEQGVARRGEGVRDRLVFQALGRGQKPACHVKVG